jgi:hypothetical protein
MNQIFLQNKFSIFYIKNYLALTEGYIEWFLKDSSAVEMKMYML